MKFKVLFLLLIVGLFFIQGCSIIKEGNVARREARESCGEKSLYAMDCDELYDCLIKRTDPKIGKGFLPLFMNAPYESKIFDMMLIRECKLQ